MMLSCRRRPPTTMTTVVSSMIVNAAKATALIPRRRYNNTNNNNTIMAPIIIIGPSLSFHRRHPLVKQSRFTFPGGRRWFASPSATDTGGVTKSTLLVDFNANDNSDDDDEDDDDDDEGWLPPDDSPLVVNTMTKTKKKRTKQRSPPSLASSEEEGVEEPLTVSSSLRLTEQRQQQRQYENNDDDENDDEEEFILPSENSIIEVIDIEATLANEYNQQLLKRSVSSGSTKDNDSGGEESSLLLRRGSVKHSSGRSTNDDNNSSGVALSSREEIMGEEEEDEEFQVQLSDIDSWGDILQELYDTKQMDVIHRLVKEYNLHTLYESIVAAAQDSSASAAASTSTTNDTVVKRMNNPNSMRDDEEDDNSNDNDDDEELVYDEEFIMSLQGLTKDEIINELIEYSPSLTQLEMEIISSEMSKNRSLLRTKDDDDDDSLDLNTIPEYNEFRSMVLDDYYQELKKMKQQHGEHQMTTDWKDYDTRVALQNDFATSDIIDNDNIHDKEGVLEPPTSSSMVADDTLDSTIDWLHARRLRLGGDTNNNSKSNSTPNKDNNNSSNTTPTQLLTPGQAEVFQHQNSHIPIHMYTLFTTSELSMSLLAQGGTDIHIINTSSNHPQHVNSTGGGGVGIGCDYILLCTGRNPAHIRTLADSIVRNLKLRKLNERNVLGAMHGIEGGQDIFSNKRSRNRARKLGGGGGPGSSGRMDDDWIVIDCDNIHVHILDDVTRKCLNIESLWDLSNPNSEGSKLRRINLSDDDEMDEYVTQNPIPDEYAVKLFNYSNDGGRGRDGWFTGGAGSRVQTVLSSYNRKSFSDKWNGKGSSSSSSGKKGRGSQRAKSVR